MQAEVNKILNNLVEDVLLAQEENPNVKKARLIIDTAINNADRKLSLLFAGANHEQWEMKPSTVIKQIINDHVGRMVAAEFDIQQAQAKLLNIKDPKMNDQIMLGIRNQQNNIEDFKRVIRIGKGLLADALKDELDKKDKVN